MRIRLPLVALGAPAALTLVFLLSACTPPHLLRPAEPPTEAMAVYHAFVPGEPFLPLDAPASPWQAFGDAAGGGPAGAIDAAPDALRISSQPSKRAWASPWLPVAPLGPVPANQVEELTWEASVTLEQRFFVVVELRFAGEPGALLVQATPFDLQISQDPERPGGGSSDSVPRLVGDGKPHYWRVRLTRERTELHLDGSVAWSLPGPRSLARVAFGETRTDQLHGGSLTLRDLVYVRRPA